MPRRRSSGPGRRAARHWRRNRTGGQTWAGWLNCAKTASRTSRTCGIRQWRSLWVRQLRKLARARSQHPDQRRDRPLLHGPVGALRAEAASRPGRQPIMPGIRFSQAAPAWRKRRIQQGPMSLWKPPNPTKLRGRCLIFPSRPVSCTPSAEPTSRPRSRSRAPDQAPPAKEKP